MIDYGMGNLRSVSKAVEHVAGDADVPPEDGGCGCRVSGVPDGGLPWALLLLGLLLLLFDGLQLLDRLLKLLGSLGVFFRCEVILQAGHLVDRFGGLRVIRATDIADDDQVGSELEVGTRDRAQLGGGDVVDRRDRDRHHQGDAHDGQQRHLPADPDVAHVVVERDRHHTVLSMSVIRAR